MAFKQILAFIKKLFSSLCFTCLDNTFRKVEFIFCIILYIVLEKLMRIGVAEQFNGIYAQIESIISVYLAFRFIYLGLSFVLILNTASALIRIVLFVSNHSMNMLIGIITCIVTMIFSVAISFLANSQYRQRGNLELLSISDELTNLYNERHFHSVLEMEINNSKEANTPLGLILIDIDDFKMFNGVYGHNEGDNFLKFFSKLLKHHVNKKGTIYRYEGDEFAIILPGIDMSGIQSLAHKIKENFEISKKRHFKNKSNFHISISMGLAEYPNTASNKDDLFSKADMALYHAKNRGKNIITFYQDVVLQLSRDIGSDHAQLLGAFKALLSSISILDKYTFGHSERVSTYAVMLGKAMNLEEKDIKVLQYAGLLHDIGKIGIPISILNKSEHLTDEEFKLIKKHPVYSANILERLEDMSDLIDYVRHHHERFDGKGYPDGLNGEKISLGARILCVADCYDAMLSKRLYNEDRTIEDVLDEMEFLSGTQFDPKIVDLFIKLMRP